VAAVPDEHPVQAFGVYRANPAFGLRVRLRRPRRGLEHVDAGRREHRVEGGGERGVAVADEEPEPVGVLVEVR